MNHLAGILYPACLLALLAVPPLAMWRWGLAASLVTSVAEVALVVLVWAYVIPTSPYPIEPGESPLLQIRRSQANAYAMLIVLVVIPASAALIGGGLSAAWWVIRAVWRSAGHRVRP